MSLSATQNLPNLTLLRLMNDHTGAFAEAIRGVNTPELQVADNDYAVGLVVDKVAHSPYAAATLIFVVEDDAQDGPDHIDAHRSIAFVAGPHVKQGQLVSERYTTVSLIRDDRGNPRHSAAEPPRRRCQADDRNFRP
jgi:hypothetical protein